MNRITNNVLIDDTTVDLHTIYRIARGEKSIKISDDPAFINKIENSKQLFDKALENNVPIYGVNTGFGKSCGHRFDPSLSPQNGVNLFQFHGCGTGDYIGIEETRGAIISRIISLTKGYSGVSYDLLLKLADLINHGITPLVPSEGSVGASGDLTPMSYVAAVLAGYRDVDYQGTQMPAREALEKAGLPLHEFEPKEVLAIMNGTTTMTGISVFVVERAKNILKAAQWATVLAVHGLKGNRHHYHETISKAKPHPGQIHVATNLLNLLTPKQDNTDLESQQPENLQDPYSLRCSPQILGVLYDCIEWAEKWVEQEANSANDNPLVEPETGEILMSGNFYGGHIALAMDSLKTAVASVADMADRQVQNMVNPNVNRGLPADLVRKEGNDNLTHHGFKAMSIATSALAAEALKNTMPATSFSRSTESHNQDKVSMGTIAARDAERICTLTERVCAIALMSSAQACEIRGGYENRPDVTEILKKVRNQAQATIEDRPMDQEIETLRLAIKNSTLFTE